MPNLSLWNHILLTDCTTFQRTSRGKAWGVFHCGSNQLEDKGAQENISIEMFSSETNLWKIFSQNRCQDRWPWISKLKARWTVSIWNKNSTHSASLLCPLCVSDEQRSVWKALPEAWEPSQGEKKKKTVSVNSFRVQKPYEAQFTLKHGDILIWKSKSASCMLTRIDAGRWKNAVDATHWSATAQVSLSVKRLGRKHGQGISMTGGMINNILQYSLIFMQSEINLKIDGLSAAQTSLRVE